ncbi:MAG: CpsD/CapB family tyrosine-protein kinase [Deltaproteobacteria bacterium]|nr:CpsD/CapB family tyrosine-protein kinase [Deltaproteobacteria bacterium]
MNPTIERSGNFATRVDANASFNDIDNRVVAITQPASAAAEQFRLLYHRLERVRATRPLKTVAFTSAVAGEGKTLTVVNLALAAAAANPERRVLLMDCDLRRPTVHTLLGLTPQPGLAEVLRGEAQVPSALRRFASTRLAVMPAGGKVEEAADLLHSSVMRQLMKHAADHFDEVYLDAPPCLAFADAHILATQCQGVVMVVKAGQTSSRRVSQALSQLHDAPVLGCVLNGVDVAELAYR